MKLTPEAKEILTKELSKVAVMEAAVTQAQTKIAVLERELSVYKSVLDWVKEGVIDAFEAPTKAKEYIVNEELFKAVKEAHGAGIPLSVFGIEGLERNEAALFDVSDKLVENLKAGLKDIDN